MERWAAGNLEDRIEADLKFHRTMCQLTGNETLVHSWTSLEGSIRMSIMFAGVDRAIKNMDVKRHSDIVDAIETGDADTAEATMRDHMAGAAKFSWKAPPDTHRVESRGEQRGAFLLVGLGVVVAWLLIVVLLARLHDWACWRLSISTGLERDQQRCAPRWLGTATAVRGAGGGRGGVWGLGTSLRRR